MLCKDLTLPFKSHFEAFNVLVLSLTIIFAGLGALNFLSLQGVFFLLSCFFGIIWVLLRGKIYIDVILIVTIIFAASYVICEGIHNGFSWNQVLAPLILFPSLYQIGRALADYGRGFSLVWIISVVITIGFFLHAFLIVYENITYEGFKFDDGYIHSFWDQGGLVSRTGLSLYIASALGLVIPIVILKNKYRKPYFVIPSILVFVFAIWATATIGNRALLAVIAILGVGWTVVLFLSFKSLISKAIFANIVFILIAILIISFMGYGPLGRWFSSTSVFERIISGGSDTERMSKYIQFIQNFIYYPFGGLNQSLGYVHNLYLDFYNFGGIIPFACATAFFIRSGNRLIWLKKNNYLKDIRYVCIVSTVIAMYTLGLFEPIFQANRFTMFIPFLFFSYVEGLSKNHNEGRIKRTEMIIE